MTTTNMLGLIEHTPYEAVRPHLQTGDIVLFSGSGLVSEAIKLFTRSKWSHVGMVVKDPVTDTVLIWESTTLSNVKDYYDRTYKQGVQVCSLSHRIEAYDGEVGFNLLNLKLDKSQLDVLGKFRKSMKNKPYEKSKLSLLFSAIDCFDWHEDDDYTSVFCSELVAGALKKVGYLPGDIPADEYVPDDFVKLKFTAD